MASERTHGLTGATAVLSAGHPEPQEQPARQPHALADQAAELLDQTLRRAHEGPGDPSEGRARGPGATGGGASSKEGDRAPYMPRCMPHGPWQRNAYTLRMDETMNRFGRRASASGAAVRKRLQVSLCMRRSGRFDLPAELAPMVQPALVVPVPPDIPTEGGTSRLAYGLVAAYALKRHRSGKQKAPAALA